MTVRGRVTDHPSEAQNFGDSGEWVREDDDKELCGFVESSGRDTIEYHLKE